MELVVIQHEGFSEGLEDSLGEPGRMFLPTYFWQYQQKLIAAEASNGIAPAHKAPQSIANSTEQLISRAVSQCIINALEVIQIEKHYSELLLLAMCLTQG